MTTQRFFLSNRVLSASLSGMVLILMTLPAFAAETLPAEQLTNATTPTIPETVNAQISETVTQTPVSSTTETPEALRYLTLASAPMPLKDYSEKKFSGYTITLQNAQDVHLEVLSAEVINGVDELVAAHMAAESRASKRRMAGVLLRGLSAVPGVAMAGVGSWGAYQAANIAGNAAYTAGNLADTSAQTGFSATGQFQKKVSSVFLSPKQIYTFNTLVSEGMTPQIKVVFKNLQTNQVFDVQL